MIIPGYIISFDSEQDVRILDQNVQMEELGKSKKEIERLQVVLLAAMAFRFNKLAKDVPPYLSATILDSDNFMDNEEYNIRTVDSPEEIREYPRGFAYRMIIDENGDAVANCQPFGFGILGKNIDKYSKLACMYIITYLKLSKNNEGYSEKLNKLLEDLSTELNSDYEVNFAESRASFNIAKKHFGDSYT